MGYNADSSLYLAVPLDKVEAFRKELIAADMKVSKGATEADYESTPTAFLVVALINEDNGGDEEVIGNELIITGWGGGKCYRARTSTRCCRLWTCGVLTWASCSMRCSRSGRCCAAARSAGSRPRKHRAEDCVIQ